MSQCHRVIEVMDVSLYLSIIRRRWPIVVALPLLAALASLVAGLREPPLYGATAQLLVNRSAALTGETSGLTNAGEDTTAQDLPAIVSGEPFARDVVQELARRGSPIDQAIVSGALHGSNEQRVVSVAATTARPEDAVAILQAAVALIKTNGLRYWGDPNATPQRPGLFVEVLNLPTTAARLNGTGAILRDVALRAFVALLAAIGLAFLMHYITAGRQTTSQRARAGDEQQPLAPPPVVHGAASVVQTERSE